MGSSLKLRFQWATVFGKPLAVCASSDADWPRAMPISALLTGNEGASLVDDIEWIADGISKLDAVLSGRIEDESWD